MTPDHLRGSVFGNRKIGNTTKITNHLAVSTILCVKDEAYFFRSQRGNHVGSHFVLS